MATFPTGPAEQPPPNLPDLPDGPPQLANYLRTFALWCRNGFRAKLDANTALPGILLQAYDAPTGTAPNVYLLRVNQVGNFVAEQIPLGGGKP
jgi:hypothetical protein